VRKVTKIKAQKEAKKRKHVEEKKRRKRLEYLKKLQNEVLVKDAENSHVMGAKHKKVANISLKNKTRL